MKKNLTIEEAKKALQNEAKRVRKANAIDGDLLKVTCNQKQQANGVFTVYSRDFEQFKTLMIEVGSKFGTLIAMEPGKKSNDGASNIEGRIRFAFFGSAEDEGTEICGKDVDAPVDQEEIEEDVEYGKDFKGVPVMLPGDVMTGLIGACMKAKVEYELDGHQMCLAKEKCWNNHFVVTMRDTDFCTDQDKLMPFGHYGYLVAVNKHSDGVDYVFRLYTETDRQQIKLDLRQVVKPEEPKEAPEKATETPQATRPTQNSKPLTEAKKDILKHAGKVRKQHNIAGSDFRIICTDYHISIGEFILFTKGANYEHLLHEFEQFGVHYTTERAGEDAMRYRFDYKKAN